MTITVMRRIKFNAGHRLLHHEGKCAYFHGHNYVADFYISGDGTDSVGRIIDFAELKRVLKGWIDKNWDHSFVVSKEDTNAIEALSMVKPSKFFCLSDNPTAENMATHLLEVVCPQILGSMNVVAWKVVLWETEESCAEAVLESIPVANSDAVESHEGEVSSEVDSREAKSEIASQKPYIQHSSE